MSQTFHELFIGRQYELARVDAMVRDPERRCHIWPIIGEGGVGKTWLLRELAQRYRENSDVIVVTIDYNEAQNLSLPSLSHRVFSQFVSLLPVEDVRKFLAMLDQVERMSEIDVNASQIAEELQRVNLFGVDLVNTVSQAKRILILSDSVDASHADAQNDIDRLGSLFQNTVTVLVGRPTPSVYSIYDAHSEIYSHWIRHSVHTISDFDEIEVKQYLEGFLSSQSLLSSSDEVSAIEIEEELIKKIVRLTRGNPVKVSIVGEWLRSNISLPNEIDFRVSDFDTFSTDKQQQIRNRFEAELFNGIRSLNDPINWVILYLSFFNRRFDSQILSTLLQIDVDQMKEVLEQLSHLVFVRKSTDSDVGMLHDEVQVLVNRHVWPFVDPDGSMRRNITRIVVEQYYEPLIRRLHEQLNDFLIFHSSKIEEHYSALPIDSHKEHTVLYLQLEQIDYTFRYSEAEGWRLLGQVLRSATFLQINTIIEIVNSWMPDISDHPRLFIELAEVYSSKGEYDRAEIYANLVINAFNKSEEDEVRALCVQAECEQEFQRKSEQFEQAILRARSLEKKTLLASVLNSLGQAYRRIGQWEGAEHYYHEALKLWIEGTSEYAATLNNLAFACMLNGKIAEADNLADEALFIRQRLIDQRGIGLSYLTRGRIASALGDYGEALRRFHVAAEIFKRLDDNNNYALALINKAEIESYAHHFQPVHELLIIATNAQKPEIRVRAKLQIAKTRFAQARELRRLEASVVEVDAKFDEAESYYADALVLSRRFRLDDLTATSLFQLALLAFLRDKREDHQHLNELQGLLQDHNYPLEQGRLYELQGDIFFKQEKFSHSIAKYVEACKVLALYNEVNFKQTFSRVRTKLREHPELKPLFCRMALEQLIGVVQGFPRAQLVAFCHTSNTFE